MVEFIMSVRSLFLADEADSERCGRLLALATSDLEVGAQHTGCQPTATGGGRIYLTGDLGAGKTTLARGILRGYGHEGAVKSPTYTLVEPYEFSRYNIYHFDLYRLSDPEEVEFLGVSDYLDGSNLCLIEWPDRGGSLLPPADLMIELAIEGRGRRVTWRTGTPRGCEIADKLSRLIELSESE
jgi:tRNA threonylcarbamoyladenosine biosynthesis protein TsaE